MNKYKIGDKLICIKDIFIKWSGGTSHIMLCGNEYKIVERLNKWDEPAWKLTLISENVKNNTPWLVGGDYYLSETKISEKFINLKRQRKEKIKKINGRIL